ncbi:Bardet-Biedl syndrome 5 protein homolog [Argonauta hians]
MAIQRGTIRHREIVLSKGGECSGYYKTCRGCQSSERTNRSAVNNKPKSDMAFPKKLVRKHISFTASFLYRDLKVRTVLMQNGELVLLPKEEICDKINGVWNLSCDRGNLGVLYLTNIRAVWSAVTNKNFNINIPYLQMESVKIQPSKYGLALTISVSEQSGGYLMGFRVDPQEKLKEIAKEVHSLLQASNMSPNFGVTYENNKQDLVLAMEDETFGEIYSGEEDIPDPLMTYLSDGTKMDGCELEFCDHLKLAMEKLPSGITAQDLWNIPSF